MTEEMSQANPKDLRKSPGGRAGLKIVYLSVCHRDDTHCVGKKVSGLLLAPFLNLQTSLSFPSRSYRRHLLIFAIANFFPSWMSVRGRTLPAVSSWTLVGGKRMECGTWSASQKVQVVASRISRTFTWLQASFCIPCHC